MAAPAGTLTYNTVVTLSAPGSSNADATTIAGAFNGITFPYVSNSAATASASGAVVTITWNQATERIADRLVMDFVATQLQSLKASLNAPVTGLTSSTQITMS